MMKPRECVASPVLKPMISMVEGLGDREVRDVECSLEEKLGEILEGAAAPN